MADLLARRFYDLDADVQRDFGTSIERLRKRHLTINGFRRDVAEALRHMLVRGESRNCVIAPPPSGPMGPCWKVVQKTEDAFIVVLIDSTENILERITFCDIDSRKVDKILTDDEKICYLQAIRENIRYFKHSWKKANLVVDIAGCVGADDAARRVLEALPRDAMATSTV